MKITRTISVLLLTALTACATTAQYEKKLESWVGEPEDKLVTAWGIPSSTYQLQDGKMILYKEDGGTSYNSIGTGIYSTNHWCNTTFTIGNDGLVKNWKWEGNMCRSQ